MNKVGHSLNSGALKTDPLRNFFFGFPSDAFMGYNAERTNYMCSGADSESERGNKAAARLNISARNFAYIKELDSTVIKNIVDVSDKSREIQSNALYFKPFLILNDAKEDGPYVAQFKKFCDDPDVKLGYNKIKELNSIVGKDGKKILNPEIGFLEYVLAQNGGDNESILSTLCKSYDIANKVVRAYRPEYEGDCIDFIYDLREDAMFSIPALADAVLNGSQNNRVCVCCDKYRSRVSGKPKTYAHVNHDSKPGDPRKITEGIDSYTEPPLNTKKDIKITKADLYQALYEVLSEKAIKYPSLARYFKTEEIKQKYVNDFLNMLSRRG